MKRSMTRLIAKHTAGVLVAGASLLASAGCRLPALKTAEPTAVMPADFKGMTTPESTAQLRVEEFFSDPALITLIHSAVANNLDLKLALQDIDIATYEVLSRQGAYLPKVSVRGEAGVDRSSKFTRNGFVDDTVTLDDRRLPNPLPDFLIAADVSWEIDIWRKLRNARDAAGLRVLATTEGRNYAVTRLVAEVADNYYALMALDKRVETLDQIIATLEQNLKAATSLRDAGRGTELGVQRFTAEVRKNRSERLLVQQEIVERENRINYLAGRYPQPVERSSAKFLDTALPAVCVGVPAQLLQNRPDIRRAERELAAAGLEVQVARAEFYPSLDITAGLGFQAFHPRYLFRPESFAANAAGGLVAPLINRRAIEAAYQTANARQLQALYDYQRVILDAVTEVVTRVTAVDNYSKSIEARKQQLQALETSVDVAGKLFQNARAEYSEVLFAQRDLLDARLVLIDTKRQQLAAMVYAYQALGGGGVQSGAPTVITATALQSVPVEPSKVGPTPTPQAAGGEKEKEKDKPMPAKPAAPPAEKQPPAPLPTTTAKR